MTLASNLAFSKWTRFKDAMTTAAVIDRLAHHSAMIEVNVPGYRVATARILVVAEHVASVSADAQKPDRRTTG